jgi:ribosomal protein L11 methyltransferase
VLDLGCGSGILSIAAAALGAGHVLAIDNDEQAVKLARQNVARNHATEIVSVRHGSLASIPKGSSFNVLAANIRATAILEMLNEGLVEYAGAGGFVILSGLLEPQLESIIKAASAAGALLSETLATDDWRTPILRLA